MTMHEVPLSRMPGIQLMRPGTRGFITGASHVQTVSAKAVKAQRCHLGLPHCQRCRCRRARGGAVPFRAVWAHCHSNRRCQHA